MRKRGKSNNKWLMLQNLIIKQHGNKKHAKKEKATENALISKSSHGNG